MSVSVKFGLSSSSKTAYFGVAPSVWEALAHGFAITKPLATAERQFATIEQLLCHDLAATNLGNQACTMSGEKFRGQRSAKP